MKFKRVLNKMDFRNMSISSLFPTTSLFFDKDKIKKLQEGSIEPEPGRLVWMKEKPLEIQNMDRYLRKKFEIPGDGKLVFSLYLPPIPGSNNLIIDKPKHRMFNRIIISTIGESPEITVMGKKKEIMKMKYDEAYSIPHPVNSMLSINFSNNRTLIIPPRKGFRQQRIRKRVENRHIMLFDYIYTDEIKQAVTEFTGKDESILGYDKPNITDEE
jgi:hypothetical protein